MCRPPTELLRPRVVDDVIASESLDEVLAAGWGSLAPEAELYASVPWLRVERRLSAERRFYLAGRSGDVAVAGLTAHLFDRYSPPWPFARIDAVLRRLCEGASPAAAPGLDDDGFGELLPTLLLGGRRPGHTRLLLATHLDEPARRAATGAMLQAAEQLARARGAASLSWLHVDEDDRLLREALLAAGHAEFASAVASSLAVTASFDAYLASFASRKRSVIQRERRRLEEAGITYEARPLSLELAEEILPLELGLYDKHGSLFPPEEARRLHAAVASELGADAQVLVALGGGAVRGFVVLVRRGDVLYARQGGFDYAFQGSLPLYFGLAFYAALEHAHRVGARSIEYGIGSDEAKASRGCTRRRQYGYVKLLDAGAHAALVGRLPHA